MKYLISLILVYGCAQVNTDSRDYYARSQKSSKGHGLISFSEKKVDSAAIERLESRGVDYRSVKRGRTLYKENCISCHGTSARGDGELAYKFKKKPLDLIKAVRERKYFRFFVNVSNKISDMPGWKARDYSERELEDLSNYLRSLK